MNSELNIAELNPVKFYSQRLAVPDNYLSRWMDDFSFQNQIKSWEQPVRYLQKWMRDDKIHIQFTTDFNTVVLEVVDCWDNVVMTVAPQLVLSVISFGYPLQFFNATVLLHSLAEGEYYLRLKVTVSTVNKYYISEPLEVRELIPDSVLLQYANSTNDYDVAFDTNIVYQMRVEGGLTDFAPETKSRVYEDQNLNNVRLSSFPFRSYKLIVGGAEGVPNYIADKINRIFACDFVLIDGKEMVRAEGGKMERRAEENYPMSAWALDVRDAVNKRAKQFKVASIFGLIDQDGVLILDIDNQPILF